MGNGIRILLWTAAVVGFLATVGGVVGLVGEGAPPEVRRVAVWLLLPGPFLLLLGVGAALALRARTHAEFRFALLQVLAAAVRRGRTPAHALSALADDYPPALRRRTWRILNEIDRGLPLSGALDRGARGLLSRSEIGALEAAEGGPRLGALLDGLVARENRRRSSVDGAARRLLYPAVVFGLAAWLGLGAVPAFRDRMAYLTARPGKEATAAASAAVAPALAVSAPATVLFLASAAGVLSFLVLEGSRRRAGPLRWIRDAAAARPGGGVLALDRAELLCRALAAASSAGLPLDRALERAAAAGGGGPGGRAVRAAAAAARRGEPAEAVFGAARLPRRVAVRLAAAAGAAPERFAAAAEALAEECGRRRADRSRLLLAAVHPATVAAGAVMVILLLGGMLSGYHRLLLDYAGGR